MGQVTTATLVFHQGALRDAAFRALPVSRIGWACRRALAGCRTHGLVHVRRVRGIGAVARKAGPRCCKMALLARLAPRPSQAFSSLCLCTRVHSRPSFIARASFFGRVNLAMQMRECTPADR
jgi:hypothetical protein